MSDDFTSWNPWAKARADEMVDWLDRTNARRPIKFPINSPMRGAIRDAFDEFRMAVIAEERERCAKVADHAFDGLVTEYAFNEASRIIAAAIREQDDE